MKVRNDQPVKLGRPWNLHLPDDTQGGGPGQYGAAWQPGRAHGRLGLQPIVSPNSLLEQTVPRDVRMMPLTTIGAILLLYVIAIGRADYFLLGLIRKRKFT